MAPTAYGTLEKDLKKINHDHKPTSTHKQTSVLIRDNKLLYVLTVLIPY